MGGFGLVLISPLIFFYLFRRLVGGTSFLLGLIRDGGGTVYVPRSVAVPRFSHIYLIRGLYIFLLISIGSIDFSQ